MYKVQEKEIFFFTYGTTFMISPKISQDLRGNNFVKKLLRHVYGTSKCMYTLF